VGVKDPNKMLNSATSLIIKPINTVIMVIIRMFFFEEDKKAIDNMRLRNKRRLFHSLINIRIGFVTKLGEINTRICGKTIKKEMSKDEIIQTDLFTEGISFLSRNQLISVR
jgi:hypothetical protein